MQTENDGRNDFDFLVGNWIMRHRRLKERLKGSTEWEEFDGTAVGKKILNGLGHMRRGRHEPEDGSHPRLHTASLRCELEGMEHLLGGRHQRDPGCPHGWQIQRWRGRVLFAGNLGRQAYLLSLHLVEDHREFRAMGTGVLNRWRQDLGDELGQYVRASGWRLRCKQKTTDGMTLIS